MAILLHAVRGTRVPLAARTLVGRSSSVNLRLETHGVSGEHAVLRWTHKGWKVRDLGSLNGTWVGAARIEPGKRLTVKRGTRLVFGTPDETWVLEDDGPPDAMAARGEHYVHSDDGLLALPSLEQPLVLIEKIDGEWMRVHEDGAAPIAHESIVNVDGEEWTILLPGRMRNTPLASTARIDPVLERRVDRASLSLAVSGDREYIEPTVTIEGESFPIDPKAHHELLLVLAESRMGDEESANGSDGEHGWVYTSELRKMLGVSSNQFYVMCHRCRREFKELGFLDAADIVERRSTSRQVRIGTRHLSVRDL